MRQGKYHISITCEHDLGLESQLIKCVWDVALHIAALHKLKIMYYDE